MGIYKTIGQKQGSNSVDFVTDTINAVNTQLYTLPWLETVFGEAEDRRPHEGLEPMVYVNLPEGNRTLKSEYNPVRPTREYGKAFSFFRPVLVTPLETFDGISNFYAETVYELIVFCNLEAINPTKGSRFERELAREVQEKVQLTVGSSAINSVVTTFADVYEGYDLQLWEENLTQAPYAAFKITFTITGETPCYS